MGTRYFVCNELALLPFVREPRKRARRTAGPQTAPSKSLMHPINSITTVGDCKRWLPKEAGEAVAAQEFAGIKNSPGILRSRVAKIQPLDLASCRRWASVVRFAALTHAGRCETSWSSERNVNFAVLAVLSRSSRARALEISNPYCGACAITRMKPSSVIEHVASSGVSSAARNRTQWATRS